MKEIERRIRAARPLSGNRNLPLSDRAKRELAELIMDESGAEHALDSSSARSQFRLSRPAFVSVAASVLALTVAVVWSLTPSPVYAATPPLLEFEPVEGTASEFLLDLAAHTCDGPWEETVEPDGSVVIATRDWNLETTLGEDGEIVSTVVQPAATTTTYYPDGSLEISAVVGEPLPFDARVGLDESQPPGTLLWELHFDAGELETEYQSLPLDTVEEVADALVGHSRYAQPEHPSFVITNLPLLLGERRLTCEETSKVLEFLAGLDGLEVAGLTSDRLGRDALTFTSERPPGEFEDYREYLSVDPNTGAILATETVYIGTERDDIGPPAVTSYTAWK